MKQIGVICFGDLETPRNGYTMRCWTIAQKLLKEGDEVAVYQFSGESKEATKDGIVLKSIGVRHERPTPSLLKKVLGFDPFGELIFIVEGYWKLRKYKSELQKFDEFYIESCELINAMAVLKPLHKVITIDTHCMNKDVALKMMPQHRIIGSIRTVIWHVIEKGMLSRADNCIAISENDQKFMEKHYHIPASKVSLIPHSVEPASAEKYQHQASELKQQYSDGGQKVALFIGDLGAIQNVESEKYIRGQLAPKTPDIHYVVVGNNPNNLKSKDNITYTGFVEAIDPYIMMADICIAPMAIGSGIKTKMLDYLKYDKTIVATPVAMEGLEPSRYTFVSDLRDFMTPVKQLAEGNS